MMMQPVFPSLPAEWFSLVDLFCVRRVDELFICLHQQSSILPGGARANPKPFYAHRLPRAATQLGCTQKQALTLSSRWCPWPTGCAL